MKLYGSPTSPYVRKARVLIKEKNIPCEFVIEDPWPEDSAIPHRNPLGKVPVLEIAADSYLFESVFVTHYLDHLDGKPLQPKAPAGYWQSQWWQALGNGIIDAVIARILETRRPADKQWTDKLAREDHDEDQEEEHAPLGQDRIDDEHRDRSLWEPTTRYSTDFQRRDSSG